MRVARGGKLPIEAIGAATFVYVVALAWCAGLHLWVIDGQMLVEHEDVFVLAEWHAIGIKEARGGVFHPHQVVSPHSALRHHQFGGEHALRKQDYWAAGLDDAPVLLPERSEWNGTVPPGVLVAFVQHAVWQVAYHAINTPAWDSLHPFQAVFAVNPIYLHQSVSFVISRSIL